MNLKLLNFSEFDSKQLFKIPNLINYMHINLKIINSLTYVTYAI